MPDYLGFKSLTIKVRKDSWAVQYKRKNSLGENKTGTFAVDVGSLNEQQLLDECLKSMRLNIKYAEQDIRVYNEKVNKGNKNESIQTSNN